MQKYNIQNKYENKSKKENLCFYGPLVPQTPTKSYPYWTNLLLPL